ncbi:MAG: universal stress protein [Candidatus Obscuribacterales bacterium]|nr:universal stress protein [Cyanobacteria bacterium HKST-UBA01]MCB9467459.1 universal stress protein [Candidatus Obscuribacterales bacterium]
MKVLVAVQDNACVESLSHFLLDYPLPEETYIQLINVISPLHIASFMNLVDDVQAANIQDEKLRLGKKHLNKLAKILNVALATDHIEESILEGDPRTAIHAVAEEWQPDLLVIGSHGKHGLASLGSVSRDLVTNCRCSVIVVPLLTPEEKKKRQNQLNHIIV